MTHAMKYRPEIDGLRAIAVMAVMIYHANNSILPGGFLGVDVFFVISGYLICRLILGDLETGTFKFTTFYERRARRILPALFLVLLVCIPVAYLTMRPSQLVDFGRSLLATGLFSSNILFWAETSYFMADSEYKPLLHTWSLAVEEQFYFVFPLLLFVLHKLVRSRLAIVFLVLILASFTTSFVLAASAPSANFYLLPSRAWELLIGALCALGPVRQFKGAGAFALFGLVAMFASFFMVNAGHPHPSWPLVPLVAGTALVLLYGTPATPAAWLLSLRPLVAIGLVSYSAYLWHVPVLVFARLQSPAELGPALSAGLLLVSFTLATASYRLVERPFRMRGESAPIQLPALVASLVLTGTTLVAVGVVIGLGLINPSTGPGPGASQNVDAKLATNYGLHIECDREFTLSPNCRTSDHPQTLLWGDSFAMHLAPALEASNMWGGFVQHTKSVCAPLPGIAVVTPEYPESWARGCLAFNDQVLEWAETQSSIRYIVLSSPFGLIHHELLLPDGRKTTEGQQDLVRASLIETSRKLGALGKRMVVVSPPPVTGENLGHCLARTMQSNLDPTSCDFLRDTAHPANTYIFDFLKSLEPDIKIVYLDTLICPNGLCDTMIGDTFMFRDEGHLSIEGSRYLGSDRDFFATILAVADR